MRKNHQFLFAFAAAFILQFVFLPGNFSLCSEPEIAPDKIWDAAAILKAPPKYKLGYKAGLTYEIYYDGELFNGQPTRVFGYLGIPEGTGPFNGKFPAVLLIHGGGGKAFANWAELWANRGYAALAMDLAGNGPAGRLEDGGPNQDDNGKFRDFTIADGDYKNMWTYHAVADILRAHAILASRHDVEPSKIAATGISWGGYLTCILSGVDPQLCCAVPVYGCGFLQDNSAWIQRFSKMSEESRNRWISLYEPSKHTCRTTCPMLFVDGTNDFAYPLDSVEKTYKSVKGDFTLAITVRRPHSHIFNFKEVDAFIDSHIYEGTDKTAQAKPLAKISPITLSEDKKSASVSFSSEVPITKAELAYTTADSVWKEREWKTIPAKIDSNTVSVELPQNPSPTCYYFLLTDERNLPVSSPLVIVSVNPIAEMKPAQAVPFGKISGTSPKPEITERNVVLRGTFSPVKKKARAAFLGGSITEMDGYRPLVCKYLQEKYPNTDFDFTAAGLSSTCSTTGAFRLQNDVLSKTTPDFFFVEFAVNDDQDAHHSEKQAIRGMEGIIRQILKCNPSANIVMTFFANENLMEQYRQGKEPVSIAAHLKVAEHYGISTVNIARELQQQIDEKKTTWQEYGGVHPALYGNTLAAGLISLAINKMPQNDKSPAELPKPLDKFCYENAHWVSPNTAKFGDDWTFTVPDWKKIPGSFRKNFANQKFLCCGKSKKELLFTFEGMAAGLFVLAGPDAGEVDYIIDGTISGKAVLYHPYSSGLHYPRTVMLNDELNPGKHILQMTISPEVLQNSKGTAARIMYFAVN